MIVAIDRLFEAHLVVGSVEDSLRFYRDRLGLEVAHVTATRHAAFLWVGAPGRTMLGLWAAGAAPAKTTSHVAFAAALNDVLAAPETLRDAGIDALDFDGSLTDEPVVLAWMPAAAVYFRDPDGNLLEYIAMLDAAPRPAAGVVPWHEWHAPR